MPRDGCIAYVRDEDIFVHYRAGQSRDAWPIRSLTLAGQSLTGGVVATVPPPTGGTVVDVEGRAAFVKLLAALHSRGLTGEASPDLNDLESDMLFLCNT